MSSCHVLRRALARLGLCSLLGIAAHSVQAGEFTNFIGMRFVDVPAGNFVMGADNCKKELQRASQKNRAALTRGDENLSDLVSNCTKGLHYDIEARDDEAPPHSVSVGSFQLGVYEVTVGQYQAALKRSSKGRKTTGDDEYGDEVPVSNLSWNEVQQFIRWLNRNKPADDTGTYRLPSEAEWEYACQAGQHSRYCGGETAETLAWSRNNSLGPDYHPHKVGSKQANDFGLYDMSGNVWEWVQDCYQKNYDHAPADGSAIEQKHCPARVIRGGSYAGPTIMRAAYRNFDLPGARFKNVGFRIARTVN